jgi:hypothetical protein
MFKVCFAFLLVIILADFCIDVNFDRVPYQEWC